MWKGGTAFAEASWGTGVVPASMSRTSRSHVMFDFFKKQRREALRAQPFPPEWSAILERNVPIYRQLPEADREELKGHIQVFLAEKHFEGCGGLELTDEIRLTIAAQACLLLLHRETDDFRKLITILVYPTAYVAKSAVPMGSGLALEGEECRLGEAWTGGVVVLSWDDVRAGAGDVHDGQNVVLHEFAHQLDMEDGEANGAPILERRSRYIAWARALGAAYEELRSDAQSGRRSVLDKYGATNPAEFFAVATECFFGKPTALRRKHPELYEELKAYYQQDPASLVPSS
jgi:Mlc titration factor MtfA (ptsG expression regulator)